MQDVKEHLKQWSFRIRQPTKRKLQTLGAEVQSSPAGGGVDQKIKISFQRQTQGTLLLSF